ncbi:MAG TPA: DnaA/Hda family protein [Pirellulales bacterium]|nr:DnaA/Hda family protein [Pirellulales bacterium]
MTKDDREIVSGLRAALVAKLGATRYETWFGLSDFSLDGDELVVRTGSSFLQEWLRKNFREAIRSVCRETLGRDVTISFQSGEARDESSEIVATTVSAGTTVPVVAMSNSVAAASAVPVCVSVTDNGHLATVSPRRYANLALFVVGDSNRLAYASIRSAASPGGSTPLLIHGPTGVGKTHLLEGLWSVTRRVRPALHALFMSAEQFTTSFLGALHGTGVPNFRRKYRGVELLVIDDLQFFAGKRATIAELLCTIDTLLRENRQIVFAADRPPEQLQELGPELIARLQGGLVCPIEAAEYATRVGIVAAHCRRWGVDAPTEVQEFVAEQMATHARALAGAVKRLNAASIAHDRPITLELAQECLVDLIGAQDRAVGLADIERATCSVFGLDPKMLQAGSTARKNNFPRMLAMWLARKHTRAALSEIGSYFGRRSHSTVISAQKKIDAWMNDGALAPSGNLPIGEAIRRVERALRLG